MSDMPEQAPASLHGLDDETIAKLTTHEQRAQFHRFKMVLQHELAKIQDRHRKNLRWLHEGNATPEQFREHEEGKAQIEEYHRRVFRALVSGLIGQERPC